MVELVSVHSSPPMVYCKGIGQVAAEWAHFEWQIEKTIWLLLKIGPKEGRLVTTQMNLRPKVEILKGLIKRTDITDKFRSAFLKHLANAAKLGEVRNMVVHGLWTPIDNKRRKGKPRKMRLYWMRGSTETRIMPRTISVSPKTLERLARQITGYTLYLGLARHQISQGLVASQAKSSA